MGLLDQLNEVLLQTPRKYWGDKATRLGSLLSDSAATGAQAYGSANSPMAPEHANTLAGLLADFTPGLGDVKSAYDGMNAAREGDYLGAALGGLGALPMVPNFGGVIKGGDKIFHAGKTNITEIDPRKLQARDSGYFGKGFYAGESPDALKGYGKVISKFEVEPGAKILDVGMSPDKNQKLANEIADFFYSQGINSAKQRGKIDSFLWEIDQIKNDPIAYRQAADRYAELNGFDVVQYAPSEIVIKSTQKLSSIK